MKHLKKYESANNVFTIYTFGRDGSGYSSHVMGLYIDDKLELEVNYGDEIYELIDGFLKGVKWSGVKFETKNIKITDYDLCYDICFNSEPLPKSLSELESMINAKNMGLI